MKDRDWRGIDKAKHFAFCAFVAAVCPPLALLVAVGKEWYDKDKGGHWCWWDILADALGIVVGCLLFWVLWFVIKHT